VSDLTPFAAADVFAFDPSNPEECTAQLGHIIEFMNAERAAMGKPPMRSLLILGWDRPYDEIVAEGNRA
jgi:hypothetical protein